MPFANDDGHPLGLSVLMRLVSAEHSDFAIHRVGSRRRQGLFAYVPPHKKPDTLPLAATTGTRRFTVNSGTLPSRAKK
jgi:hypothetical protein